ncbi:hypothetical protein ACROYT_G024476 [Oculina patagonica]
MLTRQWEKNRCSVVQILNGSRPSLERSVDVSLEHSKAFCLGCFQTATREGWSYEDEQPDEFLSVMTNSGGALIGGSCGGMAVICLVIYFLYRMLKPEPRPVVVPDTTDTRHEPAVILVSQAEGATHETRVVPDTRREPTVIIVRPAEGATNQNGAVCPRCGNASRSPPPYSEGSFSPPSTAPSFACSCPL